MKKKKWLIIPTVIVAVIVGVLIWQKNNIQILMEAGQYSSDEIKAKIEIEREKIIESVEDKPYIHVRDLNDDEINSFREGEITEEELIEKLTREEPSDDDQSSVELKTDSDGENEYSTEFSDEISTLVARVYVMRQEYTNALERMAFEAMDDYYTMPESELSKTKIAKWAAGYVEKATELEHECDAKMDDIVAQMKKILKENKGDMSLIDDVIDGYANEKSLKKAWYLSQVKERGLL